MPFWREKRTTTTLSEAFRSAGYEIEPGSIFNVADDIIVFPETRAGQERDEHHSRPVLILANSQMCREKREPVLIIAPLSHLIEIRSAPDLCIKADSENKLDSNSRVVLSHIQPLLKADLGKRVGSLSEEDFDKVKATLVWMFSLSDE
jgi:mRNA-degrading endonuclease toxin of MazEF toxin-antitoxin module